MKASRRARQRGSSLLEFTLAGIPLIFVMISVVETSRGMWNYVTLARAVNETTRFVSLRGSSCSNGTNSCSVTVGTVASRLASEAIGIPPAELSATLVTDGGAVTTCQPITSCTSNTTTWPPSSDNATGKKVTINVWYNFQSALSMFWPGAGSVQFGAVTLPAASTQRILF
jgi:hypothetical protein